MRAYCSSTMKPLENFFLMYTCVCKCVCIEKDDFAWTFIGKEIVERVFAKYVINSNIYISFIIYKSNTDFDIFMTITIRAFDTFLSLWIWILFFVFFDYSTLQLIFNCEFLFFYLNIRICTSFRKSSIKFFNHLKEFSCLFLRWNF